MPVSLAPRLDKVPPSATNVVAAKAAELRAAGRDIISLSLGEPDFDTPAHIKAAAEAAIEGGETKYTVVDGTPAVREAICAKLSRENGLDYSPSQVLVSAGGKHSLFNAMHALLDAGDKCIVPAPYWVSYPSIAQFAGAETVVVETDLESGFKMSPEQLEAAIDARTKLLVLNSPSNPTGAVYTRAELEALGEVLARHPHVTVLTDDIYERIYWGDEPYANFAMAVPSLAERTLIVNGVSKAYAMTGWRIGYTAAPAEVHKAMRTIQSQVSTCASSVSQAAAAAALSGEQACVDEMARTYRRRCGLVMERLNALPGVRANPGTGAFYAFADVREAISRVDGVDDDIAFAAWLLEECEVAVVPGAAFGTPGHIRLSFATSDTLLNQAFDRIASALPPAA